MTQICRLLPGRAHICRRWTRRSHPNLRSDRGSTTVEMVIMAPILMMMLLFIVYVGRLTQANSEVAQAADHAARAAALVSRPSMSAQAQAAASASLADSTCLNRQVSVAEGQFEVSVTVTCTIVRSDLAPLAPGQQTVSATSTEIIDVKRGDNQ